MAASSFSALFDGDLTGLTSIEQLAEWAKMDAQAWRQVAKELGDEELDDLVGIASIPNADYVSALTATAASAIIKARVNIK